MSFPSFSSRAKHYLSIAIITLPPVVAWFFLMPISVRVQDVATFFQVIAQLSGIIGIVLLSVVFLFSARWGWMERLLGPLNDMYIVHHIVGMFAFLALLLHASASVVSFILAGKPNVAGLIVPGITLSVTWGILALWLMIVLLVLTLYLRPKYGLWKRSHQLLGVALLLGGVHGLTIQSDIARSPFLRVYLLGLVGISLAVYVSFTVFKRVFVRYCRYSILNIRRFSDSVCSVVLAPEGNRCIEARPGQFVFLRFRKGKKWSESHPFSLTDIDENGEISFSFKVLGDETASFAMWLTEGVEVQVEGPFGAFGSGFDESSRVICIGGGIGITPFLSLLSAFSGYAEVFYSVKREEEAYHLSDLKKIAASSGEKIHIHSWLSDDQGLLNVDRLREVCGIRSDDVFFLCGPPTMMVALRSQLLRCGVSAKRIHSEEFSL